MGKHQYVFAFHIISNVWNVTAHWDSLSGEMNISSFHKVITFATDDLVTLGAKLSSGMVFDLVFLEYSGLSFRRVTFGLWPIYKKLNSLWHTDAIWRHRSGSTLVQVMACCLMAPSHYLNWCWLFMKDILWHSPESNFTATSHATTL